MTVFNTPEGKLLADGFHRARQRAGLSQEALADAAGVHRNTIPLIENDKREPRLGTGLKLAKALDCDPADLIRGL